MLEAHFPVAPTKSFFVRQLEDPFDWGGNAGLFGCFFDEGNHFRPALKAVIARKRELSLLHRNSVVPAPVTGLTGQARKVRAQEPSGRLLAVVTGFLQLPCLFLEVLFAWSKWK